MATSKSTEKSGRWVGGALIFSGRPDPTWVIRETVAKQLEEIWASLASWAGAPPSAPVLGYRGVFLQDARKREWFAYGGVVTLKEDGRYESRRDSRRAFEKLLLASAPKGILPPDVLEPQ